MNTLLTDEKDERFLRLVEELDKGYYERIVDELRKYDAYNEFNKPHTVILILDSNDAVGCASYRKLDDNSVEFKRVYVKPEYRKKGIAYNIIRELEKKVIGEKFKYSYIVTGKNNLPAIRLYEKLDYIRTEKFGQFRDDETVVCMKKEFR